MMKGFNLACLVAILVSVAVKADNDYPIVLVHGILGWGRDEMYGIKYFGGLQGDIHKDLESDGHRVFTAAVGPLSSNWDRACELYAQIKGGVVDYGQEHSAKHGHHRFGRTYPGFYKEWGTLDEHGNIRKIHLIGHSMGGQTVRLLAQLLSNGTHGAPSSEDPKSSALFEGGHSDWIHSITTISTPHEGTLFADGFTKIAEIAKSALTASIGILGIAKDLIASVYDFKLDQWDLQPKYSNEPLLDYMRRILSSHLFQPGYVDTSLYDLSTTGANAMNKWVVNQPDIYYYSYATMDTHKSVVLHNWKFRSVEVPHTLTMILPLQPVSYFIGGIFASVENDFGESWQKNDGVVNSISMNGLKDIVIFDKVSKPGRWHAMPQLDRMDHLAICGWTIFKKSSEVYLSHAKLLQDLPQHASSRRLSEEQHFATSDIVANISASVSSWVDTVNKVKTFEDMIAHCAGIETVVGRKYCEYLRQAGPEH